MAEKVVTLALVFEETEEEDDFYEGGTYLDYRLVRVEPVSSEIEPERAAAIAELETQMDYWHVELPWAIAGAIAGEATKVRR